MAAFATGVHYMEWTEAVYRSAATGQAVYLPLQARGSTPQLPGGQCRPFGQRLQFGPHDGWVNPGIERALREPAVSAGHGQFNLMRGVRGGEAPVHFYGVLVAPVLPRL